MHPQLQAIADEYRAAVEDEGHRRLVPMSLTRHWRPIWHVVPKHVNLRG